MSDHTNTEYYIHNTMMDKLNEAIAKINKKAIKLNLPLVTLNVIRKEWNPDENKVPQLYYIVTVDGDAPVISGWTFVGTIDRIGSVPVIRDVPNSVGIPSTYRSSAGVCDHCGTARQRKETFVLYNEQTGEYKEVGRTCLKDFLNTKSPNDIVQYISWWNNIDDWIETFQFRDNTEVGKYVYNLQHYIEWCCRVMRDMGWAGRNDVVDGGLTTGESAFKYMNNDPDFMKYSKKLTVDKEDEVKAQEVIFWVKNILSQKPSLNSYEHNLVAIFAEEGIIWKNMGIAASAVYAYQRWQEQHVEFQHRQKENKNSEFQGNVGDKIQRDVTILKTRAVAGNYGMVTFITMKDVDGNLYSWASSGDHSGFDTGV